MQNKKFLQTSSLALGLGLLTDLPVEALTLGSPNVLVDDPQVTQRTVLLQLAPREQPENTMTASWIQQDSLRPIEDMGAYKYLNPIELPERRWDSFDLSLSHFEVYYGTHAGYMNKGVTRKLPLSELGNVPGSASVDEVMRHVVLNVLPPIYKTNTELRGSYQPD